MDVIQIENMSFGYESEKNILEEINLNVKMGELILLSGPTGSGKTTFLQYIKNKLGQEAGYVMQNPDHQIFSDKVYGELAFGLNNLGYEESDIEKRIAETASYFGITKWLFRDTHSLSGGEKQIINIASIIAMRPKILLLDEPISMLDPVRANSLLSIIKNLHKDLGITIMISAHNGDEVFQEASRVIVMKQGRIVADGNPIEISEQIIQDVELNYLLPTSARIFQEKNKIPLSVSQGRLLLKGIQIIYHKKRKVFDQEKVVFEMKKVRFSYEKYGEYILNDFDLQIKKGEIFGLLGENGSGKSTAAKIACGIQIPYEGQVKILGHKVKLGNSYCSMLSQDVTSHFIEDYGIGEFKDKNPYDLSGGEQQQLALDLVLKKNPKFLILDEPAKGLDSLEKNKLIDRLIDLKEKGVAVFLVTHDVEFAACVCDRMGIMYNGKVISSDTPENFCRNNLFYTTNVSRIFQDTAKDILTVLDAKKALEGHL